MEWHGTLITGMVDGHEVVLNSSYTSAEQGKKRIDRDVRARAGVATVQMMVDLFAEAFGQ
jgi:hypothetical protein